MASGSLDSGNHSKATTGKFTDSLNTRINTAYATFTMVCFSFDTCDDIVDRETFVSSVGLGLITIQWWSL